MSTPPASPPQRQPWMAVALSASAISVVLLQLAGCATGGGPAAAPAARPAPSPAPAPAPATSSTTPEAARTQPEAATPLPAAPMTPAVVQRTLSAAIELLESGQEDAALVEIDKVLAAEGGNRLAQSLARQIREEPTALLGRESFSYRVAPGESLSLIAQRALGDRFMFYALARYNNIRVPRALAGGQVIRVPGRGMPAAPAPAPTPAAERAAPVPAPTPVAAPVPAPAPPPAAASAVPAPDPARAEREKAAAVARHTREARSAFARQDLEAAIAAWTRVLDIDPTHRTAAAERQRAIDLNERAKKLPAGR